MTGEQRVLHGDADQQPSHRERHDRQRIGLAPEQQQGSEPGDDSEVTEDERRSNAELGPIEATGDRFEVVLQRHQRHAGEGEGAERNGARIEIERADMQSGDAQGGEQQRQADDGGHDEAQQTGGMRCIAGLRILRQVAADEVAVAGGGGVAEQQHPHQQQRVAAEVLGAEHARGEHLRGERQRRTTQADGDHRQPLELRARTSAASIRPLWCGIRSR